MLNSRQDSRPFTPDGEDKSVGLVDFRIYKHSYASSVSLSRFFCAVGALLMCFLPSASTLPFFPHYH